MEFSSLFSPPGLVGLCRNGSLGLGPTLYNHKGQGLVQDMVYFSRKVQTEELVICWSLTDKGVCAHVLRQLRASWSVPERSKASLQLDMGPA